MQLPICSGRPASLVTLDRRLRPDLVAGGPQALLLLEGG